MIRVETERTLVLGDTHFPFQDDTAISAAIDYLKYIKPERVILNGDLNDFYALSKFSKDPERSLRLQEEIDVTVEFLQRVRKAAPQSDIVWNEGNHEVRMRHFLSDKAPQLAYLRSLQMESLMEVERFGIRYNRANARGAVVDVGLVSVGHFDICRKHSADTAQALVNARFGTVVTGHVHRLGAYYKRAGGKLFAGFEGGCLCDLEPEYLDDCDWHHGMVLIEKTKDKPRYFVNMIPILGGDILFEGRIF